MDNQVLLESPHHLFTAKVEVVKDHQDQANVLGTISLNEPKTLSKAHSDQIVDDMMAIQDQVLTHAKSFHAHHQQGEVLLIILLKGLAFASLRAMFNKKFSLLIKKSENFKRIYITVPTDVLSHHIVDQILGFDDFERITFVKNEADALQRLLGKK